MGPETPTALMSDTCLHGEKVAYKERELGLQLWRDKELNRILCVRVPAGLCFKAARPTSRSKRAAFMGMLVILQAHSCHTRAQRTKCKSDILY